MNAVYLTVLGGYLICAIAMHRHEGPEPEVETQLHRGMPAPLMPITLFFAYQALAAPRIAAWLTAPAVLVATGCLLAVMIFTQLRRRMVSGDDGGALSRVFYVAGGAFQSILLVMALYMAFQGEVLSRALFDPAWAVVGLVAGHAIFGVSLGFSHRSFESVRDILSYLADPRPVVGFVGKSPRQVFACIDVSIIEELVYRVAAQGALLAVTGSPVVAVGGAAVVFSMVHRHFFYNHVVDSVEFLAFSLVLGALYLWTGSLLLVVLIHTVRNLEIVFLDATAGPEEANGLRCVFYERLVVHAR